MVSCDLNYLLKSLSPNTVTMGVKDITDKLYFLFIFKNFIIGLWCLTMLC